LYVNAGRSSACSGGGDFAVPRAESQLLQVEHPITELVTGDRSRPRAQLESPRGEPPRSPADHRGRGHGDRDSPETPRIRTQLHAGARKCQRGSGRRSPACASTPSRRGRHRVSVLLYDLSLHPRDRGGGLHRPETAGRLTRAGPRALEETLIDGVPSTRGCSPPPYRAHPESLAWRIFASPLAELIVPA